MSSVNLLSSLQQVQSILTTLYPSGTGAGGTGSTSTSDSATIASFGQILAALSPQGTASGIMGAGMTGTGIASTSATSGAGSAASTGPTGADVVADAEKYLGVPYVLDGESTKGMDCSGLVQQTYKDLGITLGRGVHEQMTEGTAVPSLAQAQPGDLIVFKGGGHVAIYEGNNTVIHAPMPGRYVQNEKLWVGDSGIETIRRIVPSAGTTSTASSAQTTATTGTSAPGTTSAAVQAAALAAVQAIIQADFGLLSSPQSSTSNTSSSASSSSSQIASALSSLEAASGAGTSTATATTSTTGTSSAQQALAMEQSILAQEQL